MPEATEKPASSRDSVANTLLVSVGISLVASVLVSAAAIYLKPVQARNEGLYRQQIILDVAGLFSPGDDIDERFAAIDSRVVELATGEYTDAVDAAEFDAVEAAGDPALGVRIADSADIANIRRRARYSPVYLVRDGDRLSQIILPVYGSGLWSTMRGFIALEPDGNTVRGLRFYEHAETPGLGDQIDKPAWRALWPGKKLFADGPLPRIAVIRGRVDERSPEAVYEVDGLSGATLTGRGVTNLLRYWTGPDGFGPYLATIRSEAEQND